MKTVGRPPASTDALEQTRRVDAACCEFEGLWKRGERPLVAAFLAAAPDGDRELLARELAAIDDHYRRKAAAAGEGGSSGAEAVTLNIAGVTPPPVGRAPGGPVVAVPGFEVVAELGRGGMAVVYRARDVRLNRVVALKMIRTGANASPEELVRTRLEAEAIATLHHPNIVPLYGLIEANGQPVLVMELLEGGSLQRSLTAGPPAPERAAAILEAVARGVYHAHQRGVIHRDLKPGNILLDTDGTPKIADFGLAKRMNSDPGVTRANVIVGTPAYMAPEQVRNEVDRVGCATDIHALGCVLYEMLTGRPPFAGETISQTMRNVGTTAAPPPVRPGTRLPRDLETICLKCLEKEPDDRYRTALDLAEDLRRFQRGKPILARPLGPVARAARWVRRHPAPAALLAIFLVGGVAIVADTIGRHLEARRRAEQVEQILVRTDALRREALRDPRDRSRLAEAAAEATRAELLAQVCDARLRGRVAEVQAELLRLQGDRALTRRLDEIRSQRSAVIPSLFNPFDPERDYAEAFANSNYSVLDQPAAVAAERIRASSITQDVLGALDEWAELRRTKHGPQDRSREELLNVIELSDPEPDRLAIRRGIHRRDAGAIDRSAGALLVSGLPTPTLCLFAAVVGEVRGDPEAERLLKAIHRAHPDDFGVNSFLALRLVRHPQARAAGDALPYLHAALALNPTDPTVHNNLAAVAFERGQSDDALEHIKQAISMAPDHAMFRYHAALILDQMNRGAEAEQEYRRVLKLEPKGVRPFAMANLAVRFAQRGDLATAVKLADEAVQLAPQSGVVHFIRGQLLLETHRYPEALEALRVAAQNQIDDKTMSVNLSHALLKVGLHDEAIRVARAVLKEDESLVKLRLNLCAALAEVGREGDAVAELQKLTQQQPDYALAHFNLGQALLDLGRFEDALPPLRSAHQLGSKLPKWPYPTAKLLAEATRLIERSKALPEVLNGTKRPATGEEWLDYARCCIGRTDHAGAVRCFTEAFRAKPALEEDLDEEYRSQAVVAAARALAALRDRKDAGEAKLGLELRGRALGWFRTELVAAAPLLRDADPQTRTAARRHLQLWKQHQGLAGLRELTGWPPEERREAEGLWKQVDELLATPPAPNP